MLPLFIQMGFAEEEFLSDYSINKLTDDEVIKIKNNYTRKVLFKRIYNIKAVEYFIGKYFATNSCPNKSNNYRAQLKKLENIDSDLYQILDTFMNEWNKFDFNNSDPITGGYNSSVLKFSENLQRWAADKTFK